MAGQGTIEIEAKSISNRHVSDTAAIERTKMAQRVLAGTPIPLLAFRVWDALQTNLPGTPASDDLGIVSGTFGTSAPYISAGDLKAAGATNRRARVLVRVPEDFEIGETMNLVANASVQTHVADASCTIDFEAYLVGTDGTVSADLVSTAATSINSLTAAAYTFAINAGSIPAGGLLDIRITIACNDAASATAVIPSIWQVSLQSDRR